MFIAIHPTTYRSGGISCSRRVKFIHHISSAKWCFISSIYVGLILPLFFLKNRRVVLLSIVTHFSNHNSNSKISFALSKFLDTIVNYSVIELPEHLMCVLLTQIQGASMTPILLPLLRLHSYFYYNRIGKSCIWRDFLFLPIQIKPQDVIGPYGISVPDGAIFYIQAAADTVLFYRIFL